MESGDKQTNKKILLILLFSICGIEVPLRQITALGGG